MLSTSETTPTGCPRSKTRVRSLSIYLSIGRTKLVNLLLLLTIVYYPLLLLTNYPPTFKQGLGVFGGFRHETSSQCVLIVSGETIQSGCRWSRPRVSLSIYLSIWPNGRIGKNGESHCDRTRNETRRRRLETRRRPPHIEQLARFSLLPPRGFAHLM